MIFWVVLLWDVFLFGLGGVRFRYLLRLQLLSSQSASYPLMFIESGIERSTVLSVLLEMLILYPKAMKKVDLYYKTHEFQALFARKRFILEVATRARMQHDVLRCLHR